MSRFLIRPAVMRDVAKLEEFASQVYFLNLPRETERLKENMVLSTNSFAMKVAEDEGQYIFVIEDTKTSTVVGTSCVIERHGTVDAPHTFFEVQRREKYSKTLKGGMTHEVLVLGFDDDGPSEIGGLFLDSDFRRFEGKLGKQISMVRFMFIAVHRKRFRNQVLAEMMAPVTKSGKNLLWKEVGQKFINMDYATADRFSRYNKEFILSLFPEGPIYLCMLSPEARESVGMVGKNTVPAKKMLESIGFEYKNKIDPFDGGPHLRAETDDIDPVKTTASCTKMSAGTMSDGEWGLVSVGKNAAFRAAAGKFLSTGDGLIVEQSLFDLLKPEQGEPVHALLLK